MRKRKRIKTSLIIGAVIMLSLVLFFPSGADAAGSEGVVGSILKEVNLEDDMPEEYMGEGETEGRGKEKFFCCKGIPMTMHIPCNPDDKFSFSCEDGCNFLCEYKGYTISSSNGVTMSNKYEIVFNEPGEHILSVFKDGVLKREISIVIYEDHPAKEGEKVGDEIKYKCSVCGTVYSEKIPDGHDFEEIVEKEPSCYEEGVKIYKCMDCGYSFREILQKTHDFREEIEIGEMIDWVPLRRLVRTCTLCGYSYKIDLNHKYRVVQEKIATCTEKGWVKEKCELCGDVTTRETNVGDHSYSRWYTDKYATVFEEGTKYRECSVCRKIERKTIEKVKPVVKISNKKLSLKLGKTWNLYVTKKSDGDKVLRWETSNKKVASVNKKTGKVKGLKEGNAKITVVMKSGVKCSCNVTVKNSAKLNVKSKTMYVGKTLKLKVTGTKSKVKWSSSNKKVATVDGKGKVRARKAGKTTITAKVWGKKLKCNIIVKKKREKGNGTKKNPYSAYDTYTTDIFGARYYGQAKVKLIDYKDGKEALSYLKKNGLKKNPGKSKEYVYLKFKIDYFEGQEEILADLVLNPYTRFYTSNSRKQIQWTNIKCNDGIKDIAETDMSPGDSVTCKIIFLINSKEKPITYKIDGYDDDWNPTKTWFTTKKK